jgi:hypothetical protein
VHAPRSTWATARQREPADNHDVEMRRVDDHPARFRLWIDANVLNREGAFRRPQPPLASEGARERRAALLEDFTVYTGERAVSGGARRRA